MKITGIIPARYNSTRFPGKPLAIIEGISMIQRVYQQALKAGILNQIIVATDDQRIFDHVKDFDGQVIMTTRNHLSGTSRCAEVVEYLLDDPPDVVINIQGDEPFIHPDLIRSIAEIFHHEEVKIATAIRKINYPDDLKNHNVVKVVIDRYGKALYFSRATIPYCHNFADGQWPLETTFYQHIGIYGYRRETLMNIVQLPSSPLEKAESLEQLRWLEHGYPIHTIISQWESIAVDTPDDLMKIQFRWSGSQNFP